MAIQINGTSGISGVDGSAATPALQGTDTNSGISFPAADTVAINTGGVERSRVDSSGRLLVGTSTSVSTYQMEVVNDMSLNMALLTGRDLAGGGCFLTLRRSRGSTASPTVVSSDDAVGILDFRGYSGAASAYLSCATIKAEIDGTPDSDSTDMPGRLVFSTSADGSSTPTERMRILNDGNILMGTTDPDPATNNVAGLSYDSFLGVSSTGTAIVANRTADGGVISIRSAGTTEGSISVSGTTVTYGGGHLARWSQLLNNEDPSNILKGTVMSNLDEMCEWGEEDNEQLNKTKVSDIEGDPNVAGVFVATSFDDEGPLDFFVGMTGDMVIRIAEGVTVERGDLLMSAGDGTAKPQGDGYVQDKTIAKVTSTNVSCTHPDGSYCVPCVLMAC